MNHSFKESKSSKLCSGMLISDSHSNNLSACEQETWSSASMECRPFKDPSFDKFISERETATQAIPVTVDRGAQTVQLSESKKLTQFCTYCCVFLLF